nr:MAG TPA: hypothetical protein [Caudoviricetes sp.]
MPPSCHKAKCNFLREIYNRPFQAAFFRKRTS